MDTQKYASKKKREIKLNEIVWVEKKHKWNLSNFQAVVMINSWF
jgi:hypothetical protein